MVGICRAFVIVNLISILCLARSGRADTGREFLLSCTYGVFAGALVGAATLAVEDDPGEKVHRVARGASLGLYTGILLGLYVVYVVPSQQDAEEKEELKNLESVEPDDYGFRIQKKVPKIAQFENRIPKLTFYPVIENTRVTGAAFHYSVLRF